MSVIVTNLQFRDVASQSQSLVQHFSKSGITITPNEITYKADTSIATVLVQDIGFAISCIHKSQFDGRVVGCKKYNKAKATTNDNWGSWSGSGSGFGSNNVTSKPKHRKKSKPKSKPKINNEQPPPDDDPLLVAAETMAAINSETIEAGLPDEQCATFAVMAASTLMASLMSAVDAPPPNEDDDSVEGFQQRCNAPLSVLMADYGEFAPLPASSKAPSKKPSKAPSPPSSPKSKPKSSGMLLPNGKAAIHIVVTSFGFKYGKPKSSGGFSLSDPLPVFDCRKLDECPHYVKKLSGLSYKVKNEMLRNRNKEEEENGDSDGEHHELRNKKQTPTWVLIHAIAKKVHECLVDAIENGAGFASPLTMAVNVGSVYGRHRAVVVCEATAIAIRNILRSEDGEGKISCGVSVGTKHLHVDVDHKDGAAYGSKKVNMKDDFD